MAGNSWFLVVVFAISSGACICADTVDSSAASQCAALETCYEGGASSVPCTVATGECPPCVTFVDKACYMQVQGSCAFGSDCSDIFLSKNSSSNSISSSSSSSNTVVASTTGSSASTPQTEESSQRNGSTTSDESTTADSGGSSTVLVVAILAVAVGVAVLAVVLRKLFLRARAESEENQELPSPPATVRTASFSSNGTSLDPGIVVSRSAIGTDLSVASKSSAV